MRGRKKHRRKPRTTDSRHEQPIAANLLAKRPAPTGPNQSWLTDITYLETAEGWLYLAAILDLWSRKIVGWACGPTLHQFGPYGPAAGIETPATARGVTASF